VVYGLDHKDQVTQELYEIFGELISKTKEYASTTKTQSENLHSPQKEASSKERNHITANDSSERIRFSLSRIPQKDLMDTRYKLQEIKQELSQNPGRYKKEIIKINKIQKKMDQAIQKQKERELNKYLNTLKRNPRFYVLRVIETKGKLDTLKVHLEKNPQNNKEKLEKVYKLEAKLNTKIEKMKMSQLNKALHTFSINPGKFNKELDKYKEIQRKLLSEKENIQEHNIGILNDDKDSIKDKKMSKGKTTLEYSK